MTKDNIKQTQNSLSKNLNSEEVKVVFKEILSIKQTDILKSAWGYNSKKPGSRTHHKGKLNNQDLIYLVKEGFLTEPQVDGTMKTGFGKYFLTKKAIEELSKIRTQEDKLKEKLNIK